MCSLQIESSHKQLRDWTNWLWNEVFIHKLMESFQFSNLGKRIISLDHGWRRHLHSFCSTKQGFYRVDECLSADLMLFTNNKYFFSHSIFDLGKLKWNGKKECYRVGHQVGNSSTTSFRYYLYGMPIFASILLLHRYHCERGLFRRH